MSTEYNPSDRNAAEVASSPMSFFSVAGTIVVAGGAGAGTLIIYGPPVGAHLATPTVAYSAVGALRADHRLQIYKITGGDNSAGAGTRNAVIFTFKTVTILAGSGTVGGIIGRGNRVVDISAAGGWSIQASEMITPFAPVPAFPLVAGDPGCGISVVVSAGGSDGNIPVEMLCKLVKTKVPTA